MKYKNGDLLMLDESVLYIVEYIPNMMEVSEKHAKADGYMCIELFELAPEDYTLQIIPISAEWIDNQGFNKHNNRSMKYKRIMVEQAFIGEVNINI